MIVLGQIHRIEIHQNSLIIYLLVHLIKLNSIYFNKSKFSIHRLRPFKDNNICELCALTEDKEKRRKLMARKSCVIHEEYIDVFHKIFYIPTLEKWSFHISHVRNIGSMECRKTRNQYFQEFYAKNKYKEILYRKIQRNH